MANKTNVLALPIFRCGPADYVTQEAEMLIDPLSGEYMVEQFAT